MSKQTEDKNLPVIIPLVIYHGKPKWSISKQFISLFEEPSDMEDFIPDFKYNLYDISHMSDGEIRGTSLLKIFLTTFKYIKTENRGRCVRMLQCRSFSGLMY